MLHILLLILKWTGILLAVLAGLLILAVCAVLFAPLKYRLEASYENNIESLYAQFKVTWLLHLVGAEIRWSEGRLDWNVRVAWKRFSELDGGEKETDTLGDRTADADDTDAPGDHTRISDTDDADASGKHIQISDTDDADVSGRHTRIADADDTKMPGDRGMDAGDAEASGNSQDGGDKAVDTHTSRLRTFFRELPGRVQGFYEKICAFLRAVKAKEEKVRDFCTDEVHRRAFLEVKDALRLLGRHILPKERKLVAKIGFEDPCLTGQVLAALGIVSPFLGDNTIIVPDFEHPVLEGSVCAGGRLYGIRAVSLLWRLFWNKDLKKTINDIKHFQL